MTTDLWIAWAVVLLIQNMSFTAVSRARNSGSLLYHGIASFFSNGVWFVQMFWVFSIMDVVKETWQQEGGLAFGAFAALFYTLFTMIGSLTTHWFLRRHVERGNRKVGA